jgi:hypothetical protein
MDKIDTTKTLRIILKNPNGISSNKSNLEFQYGLARSCLLGIGVTSIAETKLNWTNTVIYHTSRWFRQTWGFSSLSSSQINEKFCSTFQPGGTLRAVVDHWTTRATEKGQDPYCLGRWSFVTLRGKRDTLLTIITAYRVYQKSSTSIGVKTVYMQQIRALKSNGIQKNPSNSTIEPNKQFILDLQAWIQLLSSQGHQIVLSIDNNKNFYTAEESCHHLTCTPNIHVTDKSHDDSLHTLAASCGFLDIPALQYSTCPFPPTYIRGTIHAYLSHLTGNSGKIWHSPSQQYLFRGS